MARFMYSQNVSLNPGEQLHFKPGRGYYAGPAAQGYGPGVGTGNYGYATGGPLRVSRKTTPKRGPGVGTGNYGYNTGGPLVVTDRHGRVIANTGKPVRPTRPRPRAPIDPYGALTNAQLQARAEAIARGQLKPELGEIRRQQAEAARQAAARQAAIQGFSTAAAGIEKGIAPAVSQGYSAATQDIGDLSQGMSQGIRADLAQTQAADEAFAASQGQTAADEISGQGLGDTVQALTGLFPGQSLAARGAAATTEAAGIPQIQLKAGRQELQAAMATAKQQNDDYAQQLIKTAAQFPGLKAQALQTLNLYELDKADYREKIREYNLNYGLQMRAEMASEAAALGKNAPKPLTPAQKAEFRYKYAALAFRKQQDINKAKASGKQIDTAASKLMGYVVYKDGSSDKSIKVAQTGAGSNKAKANRNKDMAKASSLAYTTAKSLIGTPIQATGRKYRHAKGRYIARPGARGVFPDGTTNDPRRAAKEGGVNLWRDAYRQVWGAIGGDRLIAQYNLSHQQVDLLVKSQMRRAGWRFKDAQTGTEAPGMGPG